MSTFDELNLSPALGKALKKEQITEPNEIQKLVIPDVLSGCNLIVQSETGTGKTLAYLLPLIERMKSDPSPMQVVILAPTHELVIQIHRQIERLVLNLPLNSGLVFSSVPIIGNANIQRQIDKLKEKPQIVVGSPGRVLELIKKNRIPAKSIKTIVLDEADRLMDLQNIETVLSIIKITSAEKQLLLFSATIAQRTIDKAKEVMKDPKIIKSEENITIPSSIEHIHLVADQRDKIETLRKLFRILQPEKALIFLNKNDLIDILASKLTHHGFKAGGIHGTNIKMDRKKIMEDFRSGRLPVMIASDIAARGLHIDGITHIFNMDLPEDPKDYLHRVGRTGRNGQPGMAVTIVTKAELPIIAKIQKTYKIKIELRKIYQGLIHEEDENYDDR